MTANFKDLGQMMLILLKWNQMEYRIMIRFLFCAIAALPTLLCCRTAAAQAAHAGRPERDVWADTCLVAFWNVENFFDTHDDPDTDDAEFLPEGENRWTAKRFGKKAADISKVILSMKDAFGDLPAVIGMAEVENAYVLRYLVGQTPLSVKEYGFVHYDSPDSRGIDVALLYRKDMFRVLESRAVGVALGNAERTTRDILYVKGILLGTDTLHLMVNHWPSKLGGEKKTAWKRKAAATILKGLCDSLSGCHIVAMGDFNDSHRSGSIALVGETMALPVPVVRSDNGLLQSIYEAPSFPYGYGTEDFRLARTGFPPKHIPVGTNKYRDEWSVIDIMMLSREMVSGDGFVSLADGVYYIYAPVFMLEPDSKYSGCRMFRTYTGPVYRGGFSDHLPVVLRLSVLR